MESPSAPAYRGLVPRQGLLLAASLLTLWSLPSTAQLTIESVPPNAAEGKDVLLRVHNLPGDLVGYAWYKGETVDSDLRIVSYVIDTQKTTYGPAYSDREKIYPNGSLLFQNVTLKDTGYYTLHATEKNFQSKQVTGQLRVYPTLFTFWSLPTTAQLTVESVPPNAAEGKDVLLRVHNLPGNLFGYAWYKGEIVDSSRKIISYVIDTQTTTPGPAHSVRETIYPNGSLLFQKVTLKDSGYYTLLATGKDLQNKQVTGQLRVYPSLLTLWSLPTTAQLTIESVPPSAAEGKDVLLRAHNLPGDLGGYAWYKGETVDSNHKIVSYVIDTQKITYGPAYSDREKIYPNGSLLFQNVTRKDTGYYILLAIDKNFLSKSVTGQLRVYLELPKPNITSNNSNPEAHKDPVVLTCEPRTQNTTYLWLINSQSLLVSSRLQLSKDNRTLTLLPVTRNDTGPYECETRNPVSAGRSDPFTLNVLYGPDAPTISPSNSHYLRGTNLNLSCHAASNPPAQYSWFFNGRPHHPTQELFIRNVTSNDSGSYTCLAHNSVTGLNRTTVKTITISEPVGKPSIRASNVTVTEHKDAVVLTCLTNDTGISIQWLFKNQSLLLTDRMKLSQDNSTLTIDPVRREDAGDYHCEVFNLVSSGISEPLRLDVQSSLLTLWSLPTTAQLTIESVPPNAAEGKDVLLRVHNLPGNLIGCIWYKGEIVDTSHRIISYVIDTQTTTLGPAHSGRETIYPNGSLLSQGVTLQDTGYYTLLATRNDLQHAQVTGQLRVYPSLLTLWSLPTTAQLTIESVPPNAAEGKDVLLRVHNLPGNLGSYSWYTGGKVDNSHQIVSYVIDTQTTTPGPASSGRETIYPNGSLLFQNVTLKDTGYYTLLVTDKDYQSMQVTGQIRVYHIKQVALQSLNPQTLNHLFVLRRTDLTYFLKNSS
ncbi:carcinoembryonic antigen-related cell adhesion molecule 5-like isoform X5 [Myotis daubentonii]|uniref:carcinoembryonic antigen-related cell adhesion molecule 5-like isoform X5 n=1 Tax=Myotis daubentonii TaxID=98922 RepID=UPI002873440E|nr:carcinoembryonic antigen-related cell adhesion molecule 5-like isoform X5 [Myotis daubentonii]